MLRILILYYLIMLSNAYKSISISPGGLKGFYTLGICKYLKEKYCLDDFRFYGSSAGSWNALFLSLPSSYDNYYLNEVVRIKPEEYSNLNELELSIKNIILNEPSIKKDGFNITILNNKCNICISEYRGYKFKKIIKNEFDDLDDLLECCIASSHLPYVSNGKLFYKYKNKKFIDGGLFRKNYPNFVKTDLLISHEMFRNKEILKYSKLKNLNIEMLIDTGYNDAMNYFYESNETN